MSFDPLSFKIAKHLGTTWQAFVQMHLEIDAGRIQAATAGPMFATACPNLLQEEFRKDKRAFMQKLVSGLEQEGYRDCLEDIQAWMKKSGLAVASSTEGGTHSSPPVTKKPNLVAVSDSPLEDLIAKLDTNDEKVLLELAGRCCGADSERAERIQTQVRLARTSGPSRALIRGLEGAGLEFELPGAIAKVLGPESPLLFLARAYLKTRPQREAAVDEAEDGEQIAGGHSRGHSSGNTTPLRGKHPESPPVVHKTTSGAAQSTKDAATSHPDTDFAPLIFIDFWNTRTGGIASFNMKLARSLARAKIPVLVALSKGDEHEIVAIAALEASRHPMPIPIKFVVYDEAHNKFPSFKDFKSVNVLIGHAPYSDDAAIACGGRAEFQHCKKWLFLHTTPGWVDHLEGKQNAEDKDKHVKKNIVEADLCFAVGQAIYDYWSTHLKPADRKKLRVFYPPLNGPALEREPNESILTILYMGRTDSFESKNLPVLPAIFEDLKERMGDRKFQMIVRGVDKDKMDETRAKLKGSRQAKLVLRAFGEESDIQDDLENADLVLMPSIFEPFGLVALEALSAGVPVAFSKDSGFHEYLKVFCDEDFFAPLVVEDSEEESWKKAVWGLVKGGSGKLFERGAKVRADVEKRLKETFGENVVVEQMKKEVK